MIKPIWQCPICVESVLAAVAGLVVAVTPPVINLRCRAVGEDSAACANARDVAAIVMAVAGMFAAGAAGDAVRRRVREGDIYTPHGLPGPNREDLLEKFVEQVADRVRFEPIPQEETRRFPWNPFR